MTCLDELAQMLRPAAGGVFTVSSGRAEQEALQLRIYGARDAEEVAARWRAALDDVGARASRSWVCRRIAAPGSCAAPASARRRCARRCWSVSRASPRSRAREGIVDVGDVFTVPHLLARRDAERRADRVVARGALWRGAGARASGVAALDHRTRGEPAAAAQSRAAHLRDRRRPFGDLAGDRGAGGGARRAAWRSCTRTHTPICCRSGWA